MTEPRVILALLLLPLLVAGAHATQQNDNSENEWPFTLWFIKIWGPFYSSTSSSGLKEAEPKAPERCKQCTCGVTNDMTRIVGGNVTKVKQYPWVVMLLYNGTFFCGGSLISDKYVLTAAHCVSWADHRLISVRLLEHDQDNQWETSVIDRSAKSVQVHLEYDSVDYNNDIALIRLSEPVKLEGEMRTVCLPTEGLSYTGEQGLVTGWGNTHEQGELSSQLREVTVPIMANSECQQTAYGEQRITDNMMCAGYPDGKKDACQGDSGGSLDVKNGTRYHIVGVVSWGLGCARPNIPGVYTRVNRYINWINKNTIDSCFCN